MRTFPVRAFARPTSPTLRCVTNVPMGTTTLAKTVQDVHAIVTAPKAKNVSPKGPAVFVFANHSSLVSTALDVPNNTGASLTARIVDAVRPDLFL